MGLSIALGQARSVPGDLAANLATAVRLVHEAAAAGARLLALPELFACGYDPAAVARAGPGLTLTPPSPGTAPADGSPLAPLSRAAADAGIWVVVGAALARPGGGPGPGPEPEASPYDGTAHEATAHDTTARPGTPGRSGQPYNAVLVVDPAGVVAGHYAKAHLWGPERDAFSPGTGLVAIEDGGVSLGLGICYDAGFPEFARAHRRAGAHAVLYCSAFAEGATEHRYGVYHPARAVENGVYTLVSNAVGDIAGEHYFGRSGAWDPTGRPLTALGDEEGVRVVTVDPDETALVRRELPYLAELRTDLLGAAPPQPTITRLRPSAASATTVTTATTVPRSTGAPHAARLPRR
ncbi:carbon-nitrogen hydrolase family protein [Streptomyces scopuliridis]|uniref:carbon-nitrogen hydrolase family protein n=1 Tax=Streptomyces scopuliridis TaxID=452529 RepID=UPI00368E692F